MAYAFADYAAGLWQRPEHEKAWIAAAAVVTITLLNLLGVFFGKTLQNLLSSAKVLGLIGVVVAGLAWGRSEAFAFGQEFTEAPEGTSASLGMALVFVLYAYGGWNDAVFVAAEVRDPQRNLPRALILGLLGITGIYLAVNAAYLAVLGFDAARQSATPAADVLQNQPFFGSWGANGISLLVMISALGAINGMILAGSRVYATVGEDHRLFAWLGKWSSKDGAPVAALVAQASIALLLIFGVGTPFGRNGIDAGLTRIGLGAIALGSILRWFRHARGRYRTGLLGVFPADWAVVVRPAFYRCRATSAFSSPALSATPDRILLHVRVHAAQQPRLRRVAGDARRVGDRVGTRAVWPIPDDEPYSRPIVRWFFETVTSFAETALISCGHVQLSQRKTPVP